MVPIEKRIIPPKINLNPQWRQVVAQGNGLLRSKTSNNPPTRFKCMQCEYLAPRQWHIRKDARFVLILQMGKNVITFFMECLSILHFASKWTAILSEFPYQIKLEHKQTHTHIGREKIHVLNPSREARTTSPGKRPKNFLPTFELATELVMNPETFTTPDRTPMATFSVTFVTLLTLQK